MAEQQVTAGFKPTRREVRDAVALATWCEEAAKGGYTINGEPSAQLWSRCAFRLSADVAARAEASA